MPSSADQQRIAAGGRPRSIRGWLFWCRWQIARWAMRTDRRVTGSKKKG